MTDEIKLQIDLKAKLEAINHPNISIEIYPPGKKLADHERATIFYPLTPAYFVLFKLSINNGLSSFRESSDYLFVFQHVFITSSIGIEYYFRSNGDLDGSSSSCTLLYEKTGLKGFELITIDGTKKQLLVLNLNDGNSFRSVSFEPIEKIPDNFISILNQALKVNKWL